MFFVKFVKSGKIVFMKTIFNLLLLLPLTLFSQQDSIVFVEWENKLQHYQHFIDSSLAMIDSNTNAGKIESITDKMRKSSWQLEKFYRKNIKEHCESSDTYYLSMSSALSQSCPALSSVYLLRYFTEEDECKSEERIQKKFERIAHLSWRIRQTDKVQKLIKFKTEIKEMNEDLLTYQ